VDPVRAFSVFAGAPFAAFLDSAANGGGRGRYSYIAADPFRLVTADGETRVDGAPAAGDPFTVLEAQLAQCRVPAVAGPVPFCTGAVGFLGYELGRHLERLPEAPADDLGFPEMVMGFYDTVCAFDHEKAEAFVLASDASGLDGTRRPPTPVRAQNMAARITAAPPLGPVDWGPGASWRAELGRAQYEAAVARVIDYIYAGDIFQANLSHRFLAPLAKGLSPFMLYRRLRSLSPAPFAAYLACGADKAVVSASPERFLRLDSRGRVDSRPIKGTRPRGKTAREDQAEKARLRASEKDRAENLMIVDLLRNDLSRVCRPGSVRADDLFQLETFASVHHLVSEVRGEMMAGLGPVDLLRAAFPGGSITGAPKIRAMEIISELESARRGPYCGAVAWIGFDGAMESSIIIRTLAVSGGKVVAQAGGGIVADSDPAAEFEETMTKVRPLLRSLDQQGAGP